MPSVLLLAVLAFPARATVCAGLGGCSQPQALQACMAAPKGGECPNLSPDDVRRVFEAAMKKHGLDPPPRIVIEPKLEFVTFDCRADSAKAGPSNTEANECGGRPVVTVGRSVVDMSIPCPLLRIQPEDTLEAWALHEGAHVKLKHVSCRRLEIQRLCVAWANEPAGLRTVTRLLRLLGVTAVEQLSPEGVARFRNDYIGECLQAKRDQFDSAARDQEDRADTEAQKLAKPRALECAMHGAIHYLKAINAREDTQHKSTAQRLVESEERAAAESSRIPLLGDTGDPFSAR